jgi:hypothetical protein
MSEIKIDAIRWVYENRSKLRYHPDKIASKHLNTFLKSGLLVYRQGRFLVSKQLKETFTKMEQEEKLLQKGIPIFDKNTYSSISEAAKEMWYKGRAKDKGYYITNYEAVIFTKALKGLSVLYSPDLLAVDLIISQARQAVFREDYIELEPVTYQRHRYFDTGIVNFEGLNNNYKISISEVYYDLLTYHWSKVKTPCTFVSVYAGKNMVVVLNSFVPDRYFEDIIAIVGACELGRKYS